MLFRFDTIAQNTASLLKRYLINHWPKLGFGRNLRNYSTSLMLFSHLWSLSLVVFERNAQSYILCWVPGFFLSWPYSRTPLIIYSIGKKRNYQTSSLPKWCSYHIHTPGISQVDCAVSHLCAFIYAPCSTELFL